MDLLDFYGPPIHTYTRAQALADGVLIDVTTTAREAGFALPCALNADALDQAVAWDEVNACPQDQDGRLWDVLTMARHALGVALRSDAGVRDRLAFTVLAVPNAPAATVPRHVRLDLLTGADDDGELVLTIVPTGQD